MYLEISGRASGKTSRLIAAIKNYLRKNPSGTAIIVSCSFRIEAEIKKSISKANPEFCKRLLTSKESQNVRGKYFYDEFDFIENIKISKKNYYSGTPKRKRTLEELEHPAANDNLARLLQLNKMKNVNYKAPPSFLLSYKENPFFAQDAFETEILGNYIKL